MKKLYTLSFILLASFSFGQVILHENFDYAVPGNVGGNSGTVTDIVAVNNWATQSNTLANVGTIDLFAGNLNYAGLAISTGNKILLPGANATVPRDINRTITTSSTIVYYSALINVLDNTQLSLTAPSYFIGLGTTPTATGSISSFGARIGAMSANAGANFRLSILNNSGGTPAPSFTEVATDLSFATTYLVVVKFDTSVTPVSASLWINPIVLGGAEPAGATVSAAGTNAFAAVGSIFLRNNSSSPKVEIDEIRVGATWADVTPQAMAATNLSEIAGLNVYPNPVTNGILFINSNASSNKNVAIFDLLGKKVLQTITTNEVNVSNLKSGVYFVKITEDGKSATRKLVIQ